MGEVTTEVEMKGLMDLLYADDLVVMAVGYRKIWSIEEWDETERL